MSDMQTKAPLIRMAVCEIGGDKIGLLGDSDAGVRFAREVWDHAQANFGDRVWVEARIVHGHDQGGRGWSAEPDPLALVQAEITRLRALARAGWSTAQTLAVVLGYPKSEQAAIEAMAEIDDRIRPGHA